VRPKLQWVEPVDIVNAALEQQRRRLTGRPVTLDLNTNLPIVRADPAQVVQALVQILDNAAKYSNDAAPIRVTAHADEQAVLISVHDCGAGLTVDEKRQVGERFFRGPRHATTTSGSGLGLWIANAFITANGGKVEVESAGAGRGTTVSIHLPVLPEPRFADPLPAESVSADRRPDPALSQSMASSGSSSSGPMSSGLKSSELMASEPTAADPEMMRAHVRRNARPNDEPHGFEAVVAAGRSRI
jgi:anti-sigma regulatory factor (Ser/Thr protein kinase)